MRALYALLLSIALSLALVSQAALAQEGPPHPDPAFLPAPVPAAECTVANEYEAAQYGKEIGDLIYDEGCRRIRFAFGPIVVKPGENDALLQPLTIEKPAYSGYMTRFEPNLLSADTGEPIPTEALHVHHATWIAVPSYGSGSFAASGEEKTIRSYPLGYGMKVEPSDAWLLLYMLHSDTVDPELVWLTYDVDFIDTQTAENVHNIANTKPIWRDVMTSPMPHEGMVYRGGNPIFNVHKGFGGIDPDSGRRVCVWPKENCAREDYYGHVSVHQGLPGPDEPQDRYDIKGTDWRVPDGFLDGGEGTLVHGGGHVHPGGTRVEIAQVRDGVEKTIIVSDAYYWDWDEPEKVGGAPTSWNFSMAALNADMGWKVKIREGDIIRINGVYDTEEASWYGQMGILNIHVALDDPHGPEGVDVFEDDVVLDRGVSRSGTLIPDGPFDPKTGWRPSDCTPDLEGTSGQKRLCLRGQPTHGHIPESGNFSGGSVCAANDTCPEIDAPDGEITTDIVSVGFTYGNADLGVIERNGIPLLRKGEPARFWSFDTVARVWHSFTRCAWPCTGGSDMGYPVPDGGSGDPWDVMDFDSGELGYGTTFDQTKFQVGGYAGDRSVDQRVKDGAVWEWTPTQTGEFAFWCRIHRGMRGAFKVVE
jgi:hypothetical protein